VKALAFEMTKLVGAEFPLFAFSHCRDVVAAVSRAGAFGVLGGRAFLGAIVGAGVEMDRRSRRR
jgi:hypothetical protein